MSQLHTLPKEHQDVIGAIVRQEELEDWPRLCYEAGIAAGLVRASTICDRVAALSALDKLIAYGAQKCGNAIRDILAKSHAAD